MSRNPLHDVAIVGIHNSRQARTLPGETTESLLVECIAGALDDAGLTLGDVDGIAIDGGSDVFVHQLGIGPAWHSRLAVPGIVSVLDAATAIATGQCAVAVVACAQAGSYVDRAEVAPWTRPRNEFVAPWGMITAAQFALGARVHMDRYGTTPGQLALVSATVRNNGSVNPEAVYFGRGPFTADDILASRMVADPFHLLDCATTSEGGCALVLTTAGRARDLRQPPAYLLGGAGETFGPRYVLPPAFDLRGRPDGDELGFVGRTAANKAFATAGITRADVDVAELYDAFSFEVIRQLEAFGFCGEGEGGPFVESGAIGPGGQLPVVTDGGVMSFSHSGRAQLVQKVARAARQVQRRCPTMQVPGAEVALCANSGFGPMVCDVLLLGSEPAS